MRCDCGILDGTPRWDEDEALVLALTPGIPFEWLVAALRLDNDRRRKLRDMIHGAVSNEIRDLAEANGFSVDQGDGWKMLLAVCPNYSGAVPLWSQLDLQNDQRTDVEIGKILGVNRQRVRRWRVTPVFDPLTGVRLIGSRGEFALTENFPE